MKNVLAFTALLASSIAFAEVKPMGTLVDSLCGSLNKSVELCLDKVVGFPDANYIAFKPFQRPATFVKVSGENLTPIGLLGASHYRYQGSAVVKDDNGYNIERTYVLDLHTTISPDAVIHATLQVDNGVTHDFEMRRVAITQ